MHTQFSLTTSLFAVSVQLSQQPTICMYLPWYLSNSIQVLVYAYTARTCTVYCMHILKYTACVTFCCTSMHISIAILQLLRPFLHLYAYRYYILYSIICILVVLSSLFLAFFLFLVCSRFAVCLLFLFLCCLTVFREDFFLQGLHRALQNRCS